MNAATNQLEQSQMPPQALLAQMTFGFIVWQYDALLEWNRFKLTDIYSTLSPVQIVEAVKV